MCVLGELRTLGSNVAPQTVRRYRICGSYRSSGDGVSCFGRADITRWQADEHD